MGKCISRALSKHQVEREEITKKFDSFDFRINANDEFTFIQRAKRELTGSCAPDDFMDRLFKGYREFMIEAATEILVSKKTPENGKFICTLTPAPLIDEMWCLAILYTKKYKELCEHLVGGVIERVPLTVLKGLKMFKKLWPDYTHYFWEVDRKYVVWIYNKDIGEILNLLYDKIFLLQDKEKIHLYEDDLEHNVKIFSDIISGKCSSLDLTRDEGNIPSYHKNYNPDAEGSVRDIYKKVSNLLPKTLSSEFQLKYNTGYNSRYYIQEYARFMTMIYFTKFTLTPSEGVDQVWHLHQSYTIDYRDFCMSLYGKVIDHSPTVGGEADNLKYKKFYVATVEFYKSLFQKSPPIGLWPSANNRFNPNNFLGSWYSLARTLICITRVIEMHRNTRPPDVPMEIMKCYFTWTGRNLFKKYVYNIDLKKKIKLRSGVASNSYWYAGGCVIIGAGGCEGGCGGYGGGGGRGGGGGGGGCGGGGCGGGGGGCGGGGGSGCGGCGGGGEGGGCGE